MKEKFKFSKLNTHKKGEKNTTTPMFVLKKSNKR